MDDVEKLLEAPLKPDKDVSAAPSVSLHLSFALHTSDIIGVDRKSRIAHLLEKSMSFSSPWLL
jgi:hypothetical protein